MGDYTVKQVAELSGVSIRTLHHYDEIGLLKPARVGANGYRYYGRDELLRLQQILLHRELGFTLDEIRQVLGAAEFDRKAALRAHRERLVVEIERYRRLVETLDATLAALEGKADMNDKILYHGFSPEKQAQHEAWLVNRFGNQVQARIDEAKARMQQWSGADRDRHLQEVKAIQAELAKAMADGKPADSEDVHELIRRLQEWVGRGWNSTPGREAFSRLADIYAEHPDFRARYESCRAGLTDYLVTAIRAFADRELA
jgi:MerR family transcriptional regulator, thiopeptide resistance regulator